MNRWLTVAPLTVMLCFVACHPDGLARTASPDWKFYGGVSSPNGQSWCFYDGASVMRGHDDHIRVAARCLPQTDMDRVDIETDFDGRIARDAARKRRAHYVPPYATAETVAASQRFDIVRLETIADVADIQPRVKLSYELDCGGAKTRVLSLYVQVDGKIRTVDTPGEWQPISPEANSIRLFKILCRSP